MLSTVVVGNSATMVYEGLMVTPRGYERKYSLGAQTQALKPHERLRPAAEPWSLAAAEAGASAGAEIGKAAAAEEVRSVGAQGGKTVMAEDRAGLVREKAAMADLWEMEVSPAVGSREYSGAQMKLLAELAGDEGQLIYTKDGTFLLRGSRMDEAEAGAKLIAAGLNAGVPGDYVKVKTCGFCELRRSGALNAAARLHSQLHGLAVPRELHISVAGCGMACSSAVLDDIGLVYSRGSYELYLGGKKSGRGAHAGVLVREGMDEEAAVAAVAAAVEDYIAHGRENERYSAYYERMYSSPAGIVPNNQDIPGGERTMKTVLLVGHGSRVPAGNEELLRFTGQLAVRRPELKIETCFIELAAPSILGGIAKCVEDGATQIYIVPIILFAAGHSKLDIPMAIDEAKRKYPGVEFIYGRPLGVQQRAVELLLDRISEAEQLPLRPARTSAVADEDTAVLLMGRGAVTRMPTATSISWDGCCGSEPATALWRAASLLSPSPRCRKALNAAWRWVRAELLYCRICCSPVC